MKLTMSELDELIREAKEQAFDEGVKHERGREKSRYQIPGYKWLYADSVPARNPYRP